VEGRDRTEHGRRAGRPSILALHREMNRLSTTLRDLDLFISSDLPGGGRASKSTIRPEVKIIAELPDLDEKDVRRTGKHPDYKGEKRRKMKTRIDCSASAIMAGSNGAFRLTVWLRIKSLPL
jgi:hypothetical protein